MGRRNDGVGIELTKEERRLGERNRPSSEVTTQKIVFSTDHKSLYG